MQRGFQPTQAFGQHGGLFALSVDARQLALACPFCTVRGLHAVNRWGKAAAPLCIPAKECRPPHSAH